MIQIISKILLKAPPEFAHFCVILFLKIYQNILRFFISKRLPSKVTIQIAPHHSLKVNSRLGLAAGFDKQAEVFPALSYLGFGFIEIGTVTPLPQPGNPKPRIWRVAPESLINHFGFNSVGLDAFHANIRRLKSWARCPILANIGKNKLTPVERAIDDYQKCLVALRDCVDGFVVNLSSPNTPGLRDLQSTQFLSDLSPLIPQNKPCFIKLSPDISMAQLKELCDFIQKESRLSGLVLVNTSRALSEKRGFQMGGLSGPPLFSLSLDFMEEAKEILKNSKTLIGVGGISSPEDAKLMIKSGADLIEIYTAFIYQGPKCVKEISQALR